MIASLDFMPITPSLPPPFDIIVQQLAHGEAENQTLTGRVHRGEVEWCFKVATPGYLISPARPMTGTDTPSSPTLSHPAKTFQSKANERKHSGTSS